MSTLAGQSNGVSSRKSNPHFLPSKGNNTALSISALETLAAVGLSSLTFSICTSRLAQSCPVPGKLDSSAKIRYNKIKQRDCWVSGNSHCYFRIRKEACHSIPNLPNQKRKGGNASFVVRNLITEDNEWQAKKPATKAPASRYTK